VKLDLQEFLSAYLAEVDEQLQVANGRLLEIDQHARTSTPHPRAVRDLFRALHTIKGLSAMVNVEPAVALAHRLEGIVRSADNGNGLLAPDAIDLVLKGVRAIEHAVRELSEGKPVSPPAPSLLRALDDVEPTAHGTAERRATSLDLDPAIASKLAPFESSLLLDASASGRRAVRVDFSPSPAKALRGLSINSVREHVGSVAEIVKVVPVSVPASEEAPGALSFALLLVTGASDEDIAAAVECDPSAVRTLDGGAMTRVAPVALDDDDDDVVPQRRSVVRVDVARLDDAMEHLSSLIVTRSRLARAVAELSNAGVRTRELGEIVRENARQLRDLRAAILRVRMIPVSEVLERIPLIVRGLRRGSTKQVRVTIDAGDAELDKGVAERLFPALVHLVRNAFDHAIESPEERARAGKPAEGVIRIACSASSNARLELNVSDDGAGVNRAEIARRVGSNLPNDEALLAALCTAGFSTRDNATTTSGRGMGMDIVKRVIVDQLGGELTMETSLGGGTTFFVRVPLSISIVDSFTLQCGKSRFVVPVSMVEEIIEVDRARVVRTPNGDDGVTLIERRGEALPLLDLRRALRMDGEAAAPHALVVRRSGSVMAFALQRVLGQSETVVRPLVDPLVQVPGISGATDLGDGKPTLVLDLVSLGASLLARKERAA
jgi:two-component system chemotaxis sensor kinase CheA